MIVAGDLFTENVAVTGHRPNKLGGYDNGSYMIVVRVAIDWLMNHRPRHIITGMAQGWDQAVAHACMELKIPFTAAVPFPLQASVWTAKSQRYYERLLSAADTVHYCSTQYEGPKTMHIRNRWMVDNSAVLWSLYNGDTAGGTFGCIEYAKSKNRIIVNSYPEYLKLVA